MGRTAVPAGRETGPLQERWAEQIINPDPEVRRTTVARLGAQKDERAVPSIAIRLADQDVSVRRDAAWALGEIGDSQGMVSAYARMYLPPRSGRPEAGAREPLMDADTGRRQNAAARAIPALEAALSDSDEGVRIEAARSLGRIGNAGAVPALVRALEDTDYRVRRDAIESLAMLGDRKGILPIAARLSDQDTEVRLAACAALSGIGDSSALPALRRSASGDQDESVRARAQEAINSIIRRARPVPAVDEEDEAQTG